ncbi:MAG: DUF3299 domain-containing protein [Desulfovibrio sp.]|nr:DUF3299 domain-containing protein [Desulfovibrio sp.]
MSQDRGACLTAVCLLLGLFLFFFQDYSMAEPLPVSWEDLLGDEEKAVKPSQGSGKDGVGTNSRLDKREIRIRGFVVPIERDEERKLTQFLLVPYFGACIHVPPPPENQIITVIPERGLPDVKAMDQITVEGVLSLEKRDSEGPGSVYLLTRACTIDDSSSALPWKAILIAAFCAFSVSLGFILPTGSWSPRQEAFAVITGFSAGMMLALGVSGLGIRLSAQGALLFLAGGAFMLLLRAFTHHTHEISARPSLLTRTTLAIAIHNLPETFFVLSTSIGDLTLGALISATMMAHNIPLGLSVGLFAMEKTFARRMIYITLASILPLLLAVMIYQHCRNFFPLETIRYCYPFAGGALCVIALRELLPTAHAASKNRAIFSFVLGVLFLFLMIFLFLSFSPT